MKSQSFQRPLDAVEKHTFKCRVSNKFRSLTSAPFKQNCTTKVAAAAEGLLSALAFHVCFHLFFLKVHPRFFFLCHFRNYKCFLCRNFGH